MSNTEAVKTFIINWAAEKLSISSSEINPQAHYAELGLGSVDMMTLFGELESQYDITFDPDELWELESINDICQLVASVTQ